MSDTLEVITRNFYATIYTEKIIKLTSINIVMVFFAFKMYIYKVDKRELCTYDDTHTCIELT